MTTAALISVGTTGLFCIAVAGSGLLALALFYHWIRYNLGIVSTLVVTVLYSIGTTAILLSMLGLLAQI